MAATSTSDLNGTITTSSASDGPVLSVITKRLRALRKKHNRILQMEEALAQGKTLNKEQQDVVRSKSSVLILIDELDKLRDPLSAALLEEFSLKSTSPSPPPEQQPMSVPTPATDNSGDDLKDLLNLMYFGSLFDVKPQSEFTSLMLTRTHERGCCLTYDYVTDDATELLGERDLDVISALQGLMISRPVNSTLSHRDALEKCIHHANQWLAKSDQPIDSQSIITYASLREKLNKIMASDYFTATPQMTGPGGVAAAAAVANFGSFQISIHESMPDEGPVQVEESVVQYEEKEENATSYEEYETVENQSGTVDEFQKNDLKPESPPEVVSVHADQEQSQNAGEGNLNVDFNEQQYNPRRGQRGGRGRGGRRGYSNERGGRVSGWGGGPYQNGQGQYHDNYYSRNYYNNRRGNRGGGNSYYNHSSEAQGNYTQSNVDIAS